MNTANRKSLVARIDTWLNGFDAADLIEGLIPAHLGVVSIDGVTRLYHGRTVVAEAEGRRGRKLASVCRRLGIKDLILAPVYLASRLAAA